ncbi:MAG: SPFH domain-containing protein [Candidatus ainarchaeum sp.]|nr:SPFH domain-containing protein [Candidatus ainarchaeum sp.]
MAKRFSSVESHKIKQGVFLLLLVLIITVVWLALTNMQLFAYILLSIAVLAILSFIVWRYDFLLTLKEYERAVVYRFGKVVRVGGPGWTFIMPIIESFKIVDLRTHTIDIPPQEVITKDSIVVTIDAIVYLYVKPDKQSVINSVVEIKDYEKAAEEFVKSTVRDVAGTLTLSELITNIAEFNLRVLQQIEKIAQSWGVTVEAVQISNITLPKELQDALTTQKAAEQQKLARSQLADAHKLEIEAVKAAAEQLSDKALAYYYIRALEKLGEGRSTKFFFPMELTKLAEAVGGTLAAGAAAKNSSELESLFKKYKPALKKILEKK